MILRRILFILTVGLLCWLFIDSVFELDIAAAKNDALTSMKKEGVEQMQNIDSVKSYAKSNLDIVRKNSKKKSHLAVRRIWVLSVLIISIIFLFGINTQRK